LTGDNSGDLASATESGDSLGRGCSRNSSSDDESSYTGAGDRSRRPVRANGGRLRDRRRADKIVVYVYRLAARRFRVLIERRRKSARTRRARLGRFRQALQPCRARVALGAVRHVLLGFRNARKCPSDVAGGGPFETVAPPAARAAAAAAAAAAPADDFQNAAFQFSHPPCPAAGSGTRARAPVPKWRLPLSTSSYVSELSSLDVPSSPELVSASEPDASPYAAPPYRRGRPAPARAFAAARAFRAARSLARSRSLTLDVCEKLLGFSILSGWVLLANAPPCFRCASPLGAGLPTRITRSPRGVTPTCVGVRLGGDDAEQLVVRDARGELLFARAAHRAAPEDARDEAGEGGDAVGENRQVPPDVLRARRHGADAGGGGARRLGRVLVRQVRHECAEYRRQSAGESAQRTHQARGDAESAVSGAGTAARPARTVYVQSQQDDPRAVPERGQQERHQAGRGPVAGPRGRARGLAHRA
jgi:hypothetical protein